MALFSCLRPRQQFPDAQGLRDAPRLRDAAVRALRWLRVEYLGEGTDAEFGQMRVQRAQQGRCRLPVAMYLEVRLRERPQQPGPDRSLMVRSIPAALVAAIVRA